MTVRVLLADDHALLREGLRAILGANPGITVVADVGDGREALRYAEELKPDVLVMDVSMPGLNGIEAAELVRARCPQTQVVMLSMHSSAEYLFRAMRAGALGYVLKESAAMEVIAAVQAVHLGRRYLSPALRETAGSTPADARAGPLEILSTRERQVLQLVVEGKSSAAIARIVHLSPKTVETYRSRLMKKLGVADVPSLVKFAIQHGLTPRA